MAYQGDGLVVHSSTKQHGLSVEDSPFLLSYTIIMYCRSEAILEWIAHTKVKRHILPLEIMYPTLSNRVTWVVELKTEVDT